MSAVVSFEDSVKLRLKSIVADLIPEERWASLVQAAVKEFERADLPKLVKEELATRYKKAIAEELDKPEWRGRYANAGLEASPAVQKLLIESAPLILASLLGTAAQQTLQHLQNNVHNYRGY